MTPWCAKNDKKFAMVTSCPPPGVPVETKTPANLWYKAPEAHNPPKESKKAEICDGTLPYLVGKPNNKASYAVMLSAVANGMDASCAGAWMISKTSSLKVSFTCKRSAVIPSSE